MSKIESGYPRGIEEDESMLEELKRKAEALIETWKSEGYEHVLCSEHTYYCKPVSGEEASGRADMEDHHRLYSLDEDAEKVRETLMRYSYSEFLFAKGGKSRWEAEKSAKQREE